MCEVHGGSAPQVKRKAAERLADLIDPDRALREAARLAYSDIGDLFDEHGQLLPLNDWPDRIRAAVASVEVLTRTRGAGDRVLDDVVKIKLWDKPKLIELLFKHLGLMTDRLQHDGTLEIVVHKPW